MQIEKTDVLVIGAGPSGTGSQSSVAQANGRMGAPDIDKLNMNDPFLPI